MSPHAYKPTEYATSHDRMTPGHWNDRRKLGTGDIEVFVQIETRRKGRAPLAVLMPAHWQVELPAGSNGDYYPTIAQERYASRGWTLVGDEARYRDVRIIQVEGAVDLEAVYEEEDVPPGPGVRISGGMYGL